MLLILAIPLACKECRSKALWNNPQGNICFGSKQDTFVHQESNQLSCSSVLPAQWSHP